MSINYKEKKCVVCGHPVMVDRWEQGTCHTCGWYHAPYYLTYPDRIIDPNLVSLNKARQLIKQGKPLKPTFDEFAVAFENYGEMELHYHNRRFGLRFDNDDSVRFYEWNIKGTCQVYQSVTEFKEKAHIDGAFLKELWDEIEADYMQG